MSTPPLTAKVKDTSLVLKFTSDHPEIFKNVQKHNNFINNHLSNATHSQFYLEVIENGLLYFYENFEIFRVVCVAMKYSHILKIAQNRDLLIDPETLLKDAMDESLFPAEGLNFFFEITCHRDLYAEAQNVTAAHFTAPLGEDVQVSYPPETSVKVHFSTYSSFYRYIYLLCLLISGIIFNF